MSGIDANSAQKRDRLWQQCLGRVADELQFLPEEEKAWIAGGVADIGALQGQLHELFLQGQGEALCAACRGQCCHRGHNHLTLANLCACLLSDHPPVRPDFGQSCPFMGASGCQLDVQRRPFNCVTFVCDLVENRLDPQQIRRFYALEKRLRAHYEAFDSRYAGSSLRGLLIGAERLGPRTFFQRR